MNQETLHARGPAAERAFTVLLSPTRRGARLARLLTVAHLGTWGLPTESAAHIVAEPAANATVHGRVPGRDFRLRLAVHGEGLLRIEVTDTRGECLPPTGPDGVTAPEGLAEGGRGLVLVGALADDWGVIVGPVPRKTVWAEVDLVR